MAKYREITLRVKVDTRRAERDLSRVDRQGKMLLTTFGRLGPAIASAFSVAAIAAFGRELVRINREFDSMRRRLSSAGLGAEGFGRATQLANKYGLALTSVANGLAQITAASQGTTLAGKGANDIFNAILQTSSALRLSSEQTAGALRAITQVISKGKVQAEELRGQLGERLPGAFQIAARAMGMTTEELDKALELGQVYAEDFLPKFAAELRKTFGKAAVEAAEGLDGAINRLDTSWTLFKENILDTDAVIAAVNKIKGVVDSLNEAVAGETLAPATELETRAGLAKAREQLAELSAEGGGGTRGQIKARSDALAVVRTAVKGYEDALTGSFGALAAHTTEQLNELVAAAGTGSGQGARAANVLAAAAAAELKRREEATAALERETNARDKVIREYTPPDTRKGGGGLDYAALAAAAAKTWDENQRLAERLVMSFEAPNEVAARVFREQTKNTQRLLEAGTISKEEAEVWSARYRKQLAEALMGLAPLQEPEPEINEALVNFVQNVRYGLRQALLSGNFDDVGDALLQSLRATFIDLAFDQLGELIKGKWPQLAAAFTGHGGGIVPGMGEVPSLLMGGEMVLTQTQQAGLFKALDNGLPAGGGGTVINQYNTLPGNATQETMSILGANARDVGRAVRAANERGRVRA